MPARDDNPRPRSSPKPPTSGWSGSLPRPAKYHLDDLAKLDAQLGLTQAAAKRERVEPIFLPAPHPASLSAEALLAQCDRSKKRASGPGGQHRNKVETHVTIAHTPTGLIGQAGERRSATENHREALWRLRLLLATQVRTPVPLGDCRSALWQSRCITKSSKVGRLTISPTHDDYPTMLAEALDVLWSTNLDHQSAAARLCCTASQLVKLVKDHPPALAFLNEAREVAKLPIFR